METCGFHVEFFTFLKQFDSVVKSELNYNAFCKHGKKLFQASVMYIHIQILHSTHMDVLLSSYIHSCTCMYMYYTFPHAHACACITHSLMHMYVLTHPNTPHVCEDLRLYRLSPQRWRSKKDCVTRSVNMCPILLAKVYSTLLDKMVNLRKRTCGSHG